MLSSHDLEVVMDRYAQILKSFIARNVDERLSGLVEKIIDSSCRDLIQDWVQGNGNLYFVLSLGQKPEDCFVTVELVGKPMRIFNHNGDLLISDSESKIASNVLAMLVVNCNQVIRCWIDAVQDQLLHS